MRWICLILITLTAGARGEEFVVATYNIENFREHFQAKTLATTRPSLDEGLLRRLQKEDDEDNWEVASVITDPAFNPDVLMIQEGCDQQQLEAFNKRWLKDAYATAIVFPSNSGRGQTLGMLLKPGFKVVDRKDQYYSEPDTVANPRGDKLFARGPVFVLIETPGGYKFWVGTNHQKSKSGNGVEVTKWRNREATRTNQIINEIAKSGVSDVIFLGDMNDELHYQEFEQEAGGDTIALLAGAGESKLFLATEKLAGTGANSFGGYWEGRYRSLIDHIVATPSMKDQLGEPRVVTEGLAKVASDHYAVMVRVTSDPAN